MAKKKLPYSAINDKAVQYANSKMRPLGATISTTEAWGAEHEAFKAGARFGYRLAKARKP